jgi:hypothetical protein
MALESRPPPRLPPASGHCICQASPSMPSPALPVSVIWCGPVPTGSPCPRRPCSHGAGCQCGNGPGYDQSRSTPFGIPRPPWRSRTASRRTWWPPCLAMPAWPRPSASTHTSPTPARRLWLTRSNRTPSRTSPGRPRRHGLAALKDHADADCQHGDGDRPAVGQRRRDRRGGPGRRPGRRRHRADQRDPC